MIKYEKHLLEEDTRTDKTAWLRMVGFGHVCDFSRIECMSASQIQLVYNQHVTGSMFSFGHLLGEMEACMVCQEAVMSILNAYNY